MINEFEWIQRIKESQGGTPSDGVLAIGDDCSAIPLGASLLQVTSTDGLVENIHFRTSTTSFEDLGHKALAVNLSDIAAMGAKPKWCHLTVAFPKTLAEASVQAFFDGFLAEAKAFGVCLLGGDLSASPRDIFINVCVSGEVEKTKMKTRKGFRPGVEVFLVGHCGHSALGLKFLENTNPATAGEMAQPYILEHLRPTARIPEGLWLAEQAAVLGMMDTSDGILSAATQLSRSQGVGFEFHAGSEWYQCGFEEACKLLELNPLEIAMTGGEDHGLLLAVDPKKSGALKVGFQKEFQTPIVRIGAVAESGLQVFDNGKPVEIKTSSFQHF